MIDKGEKIHFKERIEIKKTCLHKQDKRIRSFPSHNHSTSTPLHRL